MTLEKAKAYAERLLREGGYTETVTWLDGQVPGGAYFQADEHVQVYVNVRLGDAPSIALLLDGSGYYPRENTRSRAATVAALMEVLHGDKRRSYGRVWNFLSDQDLQQVLDDGIHRVFRTQADIRSLATKLASRKQQNL